MENEMSNGLGPRPLPTQADIDFQKKARTSVGPERTGKVAVIDHGHLDVGYVTEDGTNDFFCLSRNFVDASVFDSLSKGVPVRFYINAQRRITTITKA